MSILKEADFYYGAVLSTLINRGICPALVESGKDRQIYDFVTNKKEFRLFVKYRSRAINTKTPEYSSWQFHFSDDDKRELTLFMSDEKHLSVGLVCGEDQLNKSQYAVLHREEVIRLFDEQKDSFTISRKTGEKAFRISIGGGRENALQIPSNRLY